MHVFRKIFLKFSVLAILLITLYYFETSSGSYGKFQANVAQEQENGPSGRSVSSSLKGGASGNTVDVSRRSHESSLPSQEVTTKPKDYYYYNIWCIFTKVSANSPIRRKFKIFLRSLIETSSVDLSLHVIVDKDSRSIADGILKNILSSTGRYIEVQYYDVQKLALQLEDVVSVMSPYFSSKPGTYYSDALFFLSLGLHRIAPADQKVAVMFDADTKLKTDVKYLFEEFEKFGNETLFGLAPELTPVYRHVLYLYRSKHPKTAFGEPGRTGGYPGFNSGVILFHLERLRNSLEYDQIVSKDSVDHLAEKYRFKGHLGDQDFYTLLGMERPELIHTIDCGWNRQLCTWWKDRGYGDVFGNYSWCNSKVKLWHGNCNTPIPDD